MRDDRPEEGRQLLARAAASQHDHVEIELIEPAPAAQGLATIAAECDDCVLVLGSSHRGPIGRIVPGGVASLLLSCAPCAIAVAPVDYAEHTPAAISRIGVAYDGTSEADQALAKAAEAEPGSNYRCGCTTQFTRSPRIPPGTRTGGTCTTSPAKHWNEGRCSCQ